MSANDNIKVIQTIYEAFGRGDVEFILDSVTDDVDWANDTSSRVAPWYGPHHGKAGVRDFFEALAATMTVQEFEPLSYAANETEVLTVVRHKATRIANGKVVEMNLHHLFRFRDGKISYCRAGEDSAQTEATFRD